MSDITEKVEAETEKPQEQEINPVTPESILDEIVEGAAAHAVATQEFINQMQFYDKSLKEWAREMQIVVKDDLSPQEMRQLYVKLANNLQIASYFYSVASSINSAVVGGGGMKKADLVKMIVANYDVRNARRPAATVIEHMANSYMSGTVNTRVAARIVKDFWRERRDTLTEVRKIIEQIGISMHVEMKHLGGKTHDE
jgi:hypothetical protein